MKYGIALFPSKEIQDVANSFRKRYDTNYALIPPHVTVKEAFEIGSKDEIEAYIPKLKEIAKETQPFSLIAKKLSTFSPVTNTIYMKVEPVDELCKLNEKLLSTDLPDDRKYAFVPHITIAQNLSDDEHSDVYGSLQMKSFEFEETIDRFQLLYQLENGMWTVYETFRFGE
ncbi:hypothetical protein N781_15580 [Pontibacillus halophilus JSM 076056 = DSM 19796]|uniref:Putative phosphoesterase N781_15580 n=1 Tax=Pontibacillus halophilus JSM 076056 = DSM 19796 TaxID=1385510 RepID=A0A0A5GL54_9BACI|nr:YjcG family protein [Pontibacillus halophilus]KGX92729.1 hypothetical protein N781_15580 [Pontibacillus halophilus JSM 076056 = DSM 19796]